MIHFNKELIEELKSLIPQKVLDLDLKYESEEEGQVIDGNVYGWIRFDGNRLDALYLELRAMDFEPIAYGEKAICIKFDVTDDGYKFNSIYKFPEMEKEHRFDKDLNFVTEYQNYDVEGEEGEEPTDDYEFCAKIQDGKKVQSYMGYKGFSVGKEYPDFFDLLTDKKVISGGDRNNEFTFFYKKGNEQVIYLILEPPFEDEDEGRVDGEIVGFVD